MLLLHVSVVTLYGLVLPLAGICSADDKPFAPIDKKKLIGTWRGEAVGPFVRKEAKKGEKTFSLVEFRADGVIRLQVVSEQENIRMTFSSQGKYTVDGATLTIITDLGKGKESKSVAVITKLTDGELEWRNSDMKTETWKRVKDEKK